MVGVRVGIFMFGYGLGRDISVWLGLGKGYFSLVRVRVGVFQFGEGLVGVFSLVRVWVEIFQFGYA